VLGISKKVRFKILKRNVLVKGNKQKVPNKSVTKPGINNKIPPRAKKSQ